MRPHEALGSHLVLKRARKRTCQVAVTTMCTVYRESTQGHIVVERRTGVCATQKRKIKRKSAHEHKEISVGEVGVVREEGVGASQCIHLL